MHVRTSSTPWHAYLMRLKAIRMPRYSEGKFVGRLIRSRKAAEGGRGKKNEGRSDPRSKAGVREGKPHRDNITFMMQWEGKPRGTISPGREGLRGPYHPSCDATPRVHEEVKCIHRRRVTETFMCLANILSRMSARRSPAH